MPWEKALLFSILFMLVLLAIMIGIIAGLRIRARKHWAGRKPLSDDDFLSGLPVETEQQRRFCLEVRDGAAREVGIPACLVYPSEELDQVEFYPMPHDGLIVMERILGLSADEGYVLDQEKKGEGPVSAGRTLADYLRFYLVNWNRIVKGRQGDVERSSGE